MNFISRPARSGLRYLWRWLGVAEHHLGLAWSLLRRTARLSLRSALSLPKEVLLLDNAGPYPAGLFAEFAAVLGTLEHYETWQNQYVGVIVDFKDRGLYYDRAVGENWWEYYFEPIRIVGSNKDAVRKVIDNYQHVQFSVRSAGKMTRERGHRLISQYIRVRPHIQRKVDAFVHDHFHGAYVIGIHYRGTDKSVEAARVSYDNVLAVVTEKLAALGTQNIRLFLATDEQAFLDCMLNRFMDQLIYCKIFRSSNGKPTHGLNADAHQRGEEAVIDCLLLSRCHFLIRTQSHLGLCASIFNPLLPTTLLTSR